MRVSTRRGDPRVATTERLRTVPVLLEGHARCRIDGHLVLRAEPQHDAKVRVVISHPLLKPAQYEVHRVRD